LIPILPLVGFARIDVKCYDIRAHLTFFVERHSQPGVPEAAGRVPPGPSHHHVRVGDGVVEERHATAARISSVEHPRSRL